jgi:hypothetical protein
MIRPRGKDRHDGAKYSAVLGIVIAPFHFSRNRIGKPMTHQRAILVPSHGLPDKVRAVRFIQQTAHVQSANGSLGPQYRPVLPSTVEIWSGDFYGDPTGTKLASRSVSDRTEFVFPKNEMPLVAPQRSLVALILDPPVRWTVEFDSEFKDQRGNTVSRQVTIDNFGTVREALNGRNPELARY